MVIGALNIAYDAAARHASRSVRTATAAMVSCATPERGLPQEKYDGSDSPGRCDGGTPAGAGNRQVSGGSLPVTAACSGAAVRCPLEARFEPHSSRFTGGRRCDRSGGSGCDRRPSTRSQRGTATSGREVIEAALAHVVRKPVEAAYARSDRFERRRHVINAWASAFEKP